MKDFIKTTEQHTRNSSSLAPDRTVFIPSMLSGACCTLIALTVIVYAFASARIHNTSLPQMIDEWQRGLMYEPLKDPFHAGAINNAAVSTINFVLTFFFWVGIGLVLYAITFGMRDLIRAIFRFKQELTYVHVDRKARLHDALLGFGIRMSAVVFFYAFALIFTKTILPYCLYQATHLHGGVDTTVLALLVGTAVLWLSLHFLVILARLTALRPRLFGKNPRLGNL